MKKGVALFLSTLLLSTLLIGFISAQDDGITGLIKSFVDGTIDLVRTYLAPILGETNTSATSDIFMAKVIFLIILVSFVYVVLSRSMAELFKDREWALWVISIAVPLVGIRFLSAQWIATIIIPNSAFVAAVACIIPFVLFYFFTSVWSSPTARRVAWICFAVVFFSMTFVSSAKLDMVEKPIKQVYAITAIAALVMVVLDGTIQRLKRRMEREKRLTTSQYLQYSRYLKRRDELEDLLLHTGPATKAYGAIQGEIANIDKALKTLGF